MPAISHKWKPIQDLQDPASLTDGELTALLEVWKDQRPAIPEDTGVAEFSKRLAREWAIETGIIERAYTLDRGTTETLIKEGIKASLIPRESTNRDPDELAAILQDHLDALDGLFALVKGERDLSTSYIKEVHGVLLRHVKTHRVRDAAGNFFDTELVKGTYKTQPNSPTRPDGSMHEFCSPEHTASEMDRLIELYREHQLKDIPVEVEAAWLHHAFTQIHPFSDGNGRVARILASLVFIKRGGFPLLIRREDNVSYIDALERADEDDLKPLVRVFVEAQRRAAFGALQALPTLILAPMDEPKSPEDVIADIRGLLVNRGEAAPKAWATTGQILQQLSARAHERLNRILTSLLMEVGSAKPLFSFSLHADDGIMPAVATAARIYGYSIGSHLHSTRALDLYVDEKKSQIHVSLHSVGPRYVGVAAGLIFFTEPSNSFVSTVENFFQVNYKDNPAEAEKRFTRWLEQGLTRALTLWRAQL